MKKRITVQQVVVAIALIAFCTHLFLHAQQKNKIFKGIEGPKTSSVLAPPMPARWSDYHTESDTGLGVLLTDDKSSWLGLAHGLKSIGVPFSITTDYKDALRHKVVLVYPLISGAVLNETELTALSEFPGKGGTLIGSEVLGGGVNDIFGFTDAVPAKLHTFLTFSHPASDADPLETTIPIDNPQAGDDALGGYSYSKPSAHVVAVYEDGSAAILDKKVGSGRIMAIGFDLGALLFKGYENRQENMSRTYDNGYEPTLDVLLRFIQNVYTAGDDRAVTLRPVPAGKDLAVIMTHDIDYTRSLINAIEYAKYEKSVGIRGTYFVQTKYIKDYSDDIILSEESPDCLHQLRDLGMEIASHTVCHSREFRHFPMGDGTETFPDYHPFVADQNNTEDGTILGELRVSRFLLEQLTPGLHVESFRPGHLSNPYGLPQALLATDYKYSSSVTANDSLTHLPFQLTYSRENDAAVPIFEFPVTIEDEAPLLSSRLPAGGSVAQKIARHGGICVVLIHPNVLDPKLAFEKDFVAGVKAYSWFGAMEDFGKWWVARNGVTITSEWNGDRLAVHIHAPQAFDDLTIVPPPGMHAVSGQHIVKIEPKEGIVLGLLPTDSTVFLTR